MGNNLVVLVDTEYNTNAWLLPGAKKNNIECDHLLVMGYLGLLWLYGEIQRNGIPL
jgi:hypothetical protein